MAAPGAPAVKQALVVLCPGAEEIEFISVPDVLVRAGVQVCIASAAPGLQHAGSRGLPLAAQVPLAQVAEQTFDLIYVPGGLGSAKLAKTDATVQALITRQVSSGRLLAIMCAAPIALLPAGLAKGRTLTSHPSVRAELEQQAAAWRDEAVVVDGNLVTSQGAGTAVALGLTLAALLTSHEQAASVAQAMIAPLPPILSLLRTTAA